MFGFLAPSDRISTWRQCYARICQVQNRLFGMLSLPFLSYEATFLFQLAIDSQLTSPLPHDAPVCCRMNKASKGSLPSGVGYDGLINHSTAIAPVVCAAFGMLLAGVKLQDDVTDSGRWSARLLWRTIGDEFIVRKKCSSPTCPDCWVRFENVSGSIRRLSNHRHQRN